MAPFITWISDDMSSNWTLKNLKFEDSQYKTNRENSFANVVSKVMAFYSRFSVLMTVNLLRHNCVLFCIVAADDLAHQCPQHHFTQLVLWKRVVGEHNILKLIGITIKLTQG